MKLNDVLSTLFDAVRLMQSMAQEASQGRLVDLSGVEELVRKVEEINKPDRKKKARKSKEEAKATVKEAAPVDQGSNHLTMEMVRLENPPEWMMELLPNSWN